MKLKLVLLSFVLAPIVLAQHYVSPLRITHFERNNFFTWTNQICANVPIYQLLRSTNVASTNWQHYFYITNSTSTAFSDFPGGITGSSESRFLKLRWIGDRTMTFSYEFDEGYGLGPCVSGTLTISFTSFPSGTWSFQEDGFCLDGDHPTGNGSLYAQFDTYAVAPHHVRFYLSQGPEASYLDAYLQSAIVNGTCRYTGMTGTFIQGGIVSNELGTFTATRTE